MAPRTPTVQRPNTIRAVALTPADDHMLASLAREVADQIGRAPSRSVVIRALLRMTRDWDGATLARLVAVIESEIGAGVKWGRDSRRR